MQWFMETAVGNSKYSVASGLQKHSEIADNRRFAAKQKAKILLHCHGTTTHSRVLEAKFVELCLLTLNKVALERSTPTQYTVSHASQDKECVSHIFCTI
jgi:hypothetical protein